MAAIASTDLIWRLSGGAGNTDPAASLGGAMSTAGGGVITKTETFNSIFDDISSAEALAGDTEYRCVYIHNEHASLALTSAKVWISEQTGSASTIVSICLDEAGKDGTADTIADESTAPDPAPDPTFTTEAVSYATGLALGDLAAGEGFAIWIKRVVSAEMVATANDHFTLSVQGETEA